MRLFELRVYTLRSTEALNFYMNKVYPRHLRSFPLFGIEAHGFWIAKGDAEARLFVLASFPEGEDPGQIVKRYMQSTAFAEDIRDFDVSDIAGVESTILAPSASSPLR